MEEQFGNLDALNQEQDIQESLTPEKRKKLQKNLNQINRN